MAEAFLATCLVVGFVAGLCFGLNVASAAVVGVGVMAAGAVAAGTVVAVQTWWRKRRVGVRLRAVLDRREHD